MAYDLAKSAEKAYQYERNTEDTYINFGHWDSLKKGLLAHYFFSFFGKAILLIKKRLL